ncbi:MAG: hypothetical protein OEZ16_04545 [Chromatiales bacterium]|nr:hypothetical protein [Chromatiales bacterium]
MKDIVGKRFIIAGMTIDVISEDGERYVTRNITTSETVYMEKRVLENAIKLGEADEFK